MSSPVNGVVVHGAEAEADEADHPEQAGLGRHAGGPCCTASPVRHRSRLQPGMRSIIGFGSGRTTRTVTASTATVKNRATITLLP